VVPAFLDSVELPDVPVAAVKNKVLIFLSIQIAKKIVETGAVGTRPVGQHDLLKLALLAADPELEFQGGAVFPVPGRPLIIINRLFDQ
jgi:hypothetical protein